MNRIQHLRRVVLLCCHFARNLAYYRAGWNAGRPIRSTQFWVTANGNFYDICVLEWCKLFGEPKGEHHWSQVVADSRAFEAGLYSAVRTDPKTFEAFRVAMRDYRDKFVAHLDRELTANLPHLDAAESSVWFYHAYVASNELKPEDLRNLPTDLGGYYDISAAEASLIYAP